ncbi:MAG: response regulator transcription factor [Eubacteriales bacterium]
MDIKILVADDDPLLRELVCDILKKEGYKPIEASDGEQAINRLNTIGDIDLVILDVMMPKYDGWEVLKEIREYKDIPVLMLTALGDEHNEVKGLKKGADDYIAKPFKLEVFVARINALLRNLKNDRQKLLSTGNLAIDQAARRITADGNEIELNRKEYSLLVYFIRNQNRFLTREQILAGVWSYDFEGDIRTIDTHIKRLRAKLGTCGEYIKTARGVGYMFEAQDK